MPITVNSAWIAVTGFTILVIVAYPIGLAILARIKLGAGWRYFGYGALVFFFFQAVTRVPAVQLIQAAIAPQLATSPTLLWGWLAVLALTAGLFEEIGRYVGYRWLMRKEEKTWAKAVMYGLGHGGIEAFLVAVSIAGSLILILSAMASGAGALPSTQRDLAAQLAAQINAVPPWLQLSAAWERIWTIPAHVGLSVMVLQVFRRGSRAWLSLAILIHAAMDFIAVAIPRLVRLDLIGRSLLVEGIVALFGVILLGVAWTLRERATESLVMQKI